MIYGDNFIFMHPTKTGGTSVLSALKKHNGSKCHLPINGFTESVLLSSRGKRLIFCTVRNPYDRVLSMYNYFGFLKGKSFKQFLRFLQDYSATNVPLLPQHLYVKRLGVEVADLIRLESFEEGWEEIINKKLGVKVPPKKENVNSFKLKIELTDEEKEVIYKLYKTDFDMLNYTR